MTTRPLPLVHAGLCHESGPDMVAGAGGVGVGAVVVGASGAGVGSELAAVFARRARGGSGSIGGLTNGVALGDWTVDGSGCVNVSDGAKDGHVGDGEKDGDDGDGNEGAGSGEGGEMPALSSPSPTWSWESPSWSLASAAPADGRRAHRSQAAHAAAATTAAAAGAGHGRAGGRAAAAGGGATLAAESGGDDRQLTRGSTGSKSDHDHDHDHDHDKDKDKDKDDRARHVVQGGLVGRGTRAGGPSRMVASTTRLFEKNAAAAAEFAPAQQTPLPKRASFSSSFSTSTATATANAAVPSTTTTGAVAAAAQCAKEAPTPTWTLPMQSPTPTPMQSPTPTLTPLKIKRWTAASASAVSALQSPVYFKLPPRPPDQDAAPPSETSDQNKHSESLSSADTHTHSRTHANTDTTWVATTTAAATGILERTTNNNNNNTTAAAAAAAHTTISPLLATTPTSTTPKLSHSRSCSRSRSIVAVGKLDPTLWMHKTMHARENAHDTDNQNNDTNAKSTHEAPMSACQVNNEDNTNHDDADATTNTITKHKPKTKSVVSIHNASSWMRKSTTEMTDQKHCGTWCKPQCGVNDASWMRKPSVDCNHSVQDESKSVLQQSESASVATSDSDSGMALESVNTTSMVTNATMGEITNGGIAPSMSLPGHVSKKPTASISTPWDDKPLGTVAPAVTAPWKRKSWTRDDPTNVAKQHLVPEHSTTEETTTEGHNPRDGIDENNAAAIAATMAGKPGWKKTQESTLARLGKGSDLTLRVTPSSSSSWMRKPALGEQQHGEVVVGWSGSATTTTASVSVSASSSSSSSSEQEEAAETETEAEAESKTVKGTSSGALRGHAWKRPAALSKTHLEKSDPKLRGAASWMRKTVANDEQKDKTKEKAMETEREAEVAKGSNDDDAAATAAATASAALANSVGRSPTGRRLEEEEGERSTRWERSDSESQVGAPWTRAHACSERGDGVEGVPALATAAAGTTTTTTTMMENADSGNGSDNAMATVAVSLRPVWTRPRAIPTRRLEESDSKKTLKPPSWMRRPARDDIAETEGSNPGGRGGQGEGNKDDTNAGATAVPDPDRSASSSTRQEGEFASKQTKGRRTSWMQGPDGRERDNCTEVVAEGADQASGSFAAAARIPKRLAIASNWERSGRAAGTDVPSWMQKAAPGDRSEGVEEVDGEAMASSLLLLSSSSGSAETEGAYSVPGRNDMAGHVLSASALATTRRDGTDSKLLDGASWIRRDEHSDRDDAIETSTTATMTAEKEEEKEGLTDTNDTIDDATVGSVRSRLAIIAGGGKTDSKLQEVKSWMRTPARGELEDGAELSDAIAPAMITRREGPDWRLKGDSSWMRRQDRGEEESTLAPVEGAYSKELRNGDTAETLQKSTMTMTRQDGGATEASAAVPSTSSLPPVDDSAKPCHDTSIDGSGNEFASKVLNDARRNLRSTPCGRGDFSQSEDDPNLRTPKVAPSSCSFPSKCEIPAELMAAEVSVSPLATTDDSTSGVHARGSKVVEPSLLRPSPPPQQQPPQPKNSNNLSPVTSRSSSMSCNSLSSSSSILGETAPLSHVTAPRMGIVPLNKLKPLLTRAVTRGSGRGNLAASLPSSSSSSSPPPPPPPAATSSSSFSCVGDRPAEDGTTASCAPQSPVSLSLAAVGRGGIRRQLRDGGERSVEARNTGNGDDGDRGSSGRRLAIAGGSGPRNSSTGSIVVVDNVNIDDDGRNGSRDDGRGDDWTDCPASVSIAADPSTGSVQERIRMFSCSTSLSGSIGALDRESGDGSITPPFVLARAASRAGVGPDTAVVTRDARRGETTLSSSSLRLAAASEAPRKKFESTISQNVGGGDNGGGSLRSEDRKRKGKYRDARPAKILTDEDASECYFSYREPAEDQSSRPPISARKGRGAVASAESTKPLDPPGKPRLADRGRILAKARAERKAIFSNNIVSGGEAASRGVQLGRPGLKASPLLSASVETEASVVEKSGEGSAVGAARDPTRAGTLTATRPLKAGKVTLSKKLSSISGGDKKKCNNEAPISMGKSVAIDIKSPAARIADRRNKRFCVGNFESNTGNVSGAADAISDTDEGDLVSQDVSITSLAPITVTPMPLPTHIGARGDKKKLQKKKKSAVPVEKPLHVESSIQGHQPRIKSDNELLQEARQNLRPSPRNTDSNNGGAVSGALVRRTRSDEHSGTKGSIKVDGDESLSKKRVQDSAVSSSLPIPPVWSVEGNGSRRGGQSTSKGSSLVRKSAAESTSEESRAQSEENFGTKSSIEVVGDKSFAKKLVQDSATSSLLTIPPVWSTEGSGSWRGGQGTSKGSSPMRKSAAESTSEESLAQSEENSGTKGSIKVDGDESLSKKRVQDNAVSSSLSIPPVWSVVGNRSRRGGQSTSKGSSPTRKSAAESRSEESLAESEENSGKKSSIEVFGDESLSKKLVQDSEVSSSLTIPPLWSVERNRSRRGEQVMSKGSTPVRKSAAESTSVESLARSEENPGTKSSINVAGDKSVAKKLVQDSVVSSSLPTTPVCSIEGNGSWRGGQSTSKGSSPMRKSVADSTSEEKTSVVPPPISDKDAPAAWTISPSKLPPRNASARPSLWKSSPKSVPRKSVFQPHQTEPDSTATTAKENSSFVPGRHSRSLSFASIDSITCEIRQRDSLPTNIPVNSPIVAIDSVKSDKKVKSNGDGGELQAQQKEPANIAAVIQGTNMESGILSSSINSIPATESSLRGTELAPAIAPTTNVLSPRKAPGASHSVYHVPSAFSSPGGAFSSVTFSSPDRRSAFSHAKLSYQSPGQSSGNFGGSAFMPSSGPMPTSSVSGKYESRINSKNWDDDGVDSGLLLPAFSGDSMPPATAPNDDNRTVKRQLNYAQRGTNERDPVIENLRRRIQSAREEEMGRDMSSRYDFFDFGDSATSGHSGGQQIVPAVPLRMSQVHKPAHRPSGLNRRFLC